MLKFILVTNNRLVVQNFKVGETTNLKVVDFDDSIDLLRVLEKVRDYVHKGHKLLTHPLTGSIKPYETPFKSVCVSLEAGEMDYSSLTIIEESISTAQKFLKDYQPIQYSEKIYDDFRLIDNNLIASGIESINTFS